MAGAFISWISGLFHADRVNREHGNEDQEMWLIAGLGNPGAKYEGNRHNVGFMVVDELADHFSLPDFKSKFQGVMTQGVIDAHKVVLLKPQTFMNDSGRSIGEAARFYKIPPEKILIVHDELDLDLCKIRVRLGGGLAGHNGLKSAKAHLGTDAFWRLRYGIGHPGDKNRVSGYVLSDFAKAEIENVEDLNYQIVKRFEMILESKAEEFMTDLARS